MAERVTYTRDAYSFEFEVIQHQARLKRKHMPIRDLFQAAPHVLGALKPCWAMSPLVVSQLLPAQRLFDVVIFDEASQVTPADAAGALLRASRAVVAGDAHQLPPTSFFLASSGIEDDENIDELEDGTALTTNLESILDVMSILLPPPKGTRDLQWHYRSRDERLIAFSNAQPNLYDYSLTTFPGVAEDQCIHHVLVPFVMGRVGQEASVPDEVDEVVRLVALHARTRADESLGVITMGIKHSDRISEAVRRARVGDPALDAFLDDTLHEPFFVKNLERVQGDERDAIILSIGYGKNPEGRLLYRFGPLNIDGGERRLNVAITRARNRITLVSSFSSADMDPTKLRADGAKMLCDYLRYAESGGTDLGAHPIDKPILNPFERDVRDQLTRAGIPLIAQYGCSGYWIDYAAQHPTQPGRMVLAIECDGDSYHRQATARDRDRLRQNHLEALGWTFHRIWSSEWFHHREAEVNRAVGAYRAAVARADSGTAGALAGLPPDGPIAATAAPAPVRTGPMPVQPGWPIDAYSLAQLVALVQWIQSDTLLRTEDELLDAALNTLGFSKRAPESSQRWVLQSRLRNSADAPSRRERTSGLAFSGSNAAMLRLLGGERALQCARSTGNGDAGCAPAPRGGTELRSRDRLLSHARGTLLAMHRISEVLLADWGISCEAESMSCQTWMTRDAQGNVTGTTEVRSSSGCSGCLWFLLGAFVVAAPAAWVSDGQIPVVVAGFMYMVEAIVAIAALGQTANGSERHWWIVLSS